MALAFTAEEVLDIVGGVHEGLGPVEATTFSFAFSFALERAAHDTAETANRATCEPAPILLGVPILVVDVLGSLGVVHLADVGRINVFVPVV